MDQDFKPTNQGNGVTKKLLIGVVVVLVVVLGYFAFRGTGGVEVVAPGVEKRTAPEGGLVAGFPPELILEDGVELFESYSLSYTNDNVNQPAARYVSKLTLRENADMFRDYLEENGWTIVKEQDSPGVSLIYGTKGETSVNVTFVERAEGVEVNIGYLTQG